MQRIFSFIQIVVFKTTAGYFGYNYPQCITKESGFILEYDRPGLN